MFKPITRRVLASLAVLIPTVLLSACSDNDSQAVSYPELPYLTSLEQARVTVSGFSSGGYLANQLHLAYPEKIEGVAIFSAGPWGCAIKGLSHALMSCMQTRFPIASLEERMAIMHRASRNGEIGDLALVVDDPVYIFYGQSDRVVKPSISESLIGFYQTLVASYNIRITAIPEAGHAFPTLSSDNDCGDPDANHLQNCHFDGAGEALRVLYGPLQIPTSSDQLKGEFLEFGQNAFFDGKGMLDRGYLYLPESCKSGAASCQLHVVFHGCDQSAEAIGNQFFRSSGYNRWADNNNLVLLYPQARKSLPNPQGCWDWWGYEKDQFYSRDNQQLAAIIRMIERLKGDDQKNAAGRMKQADGSQ
ncbi:extracellular catalytic domain type 2 short-chain-length polyhydroxyalkanoate depolymerase [Oceanospirillum sediminis]|uniref:Poly(3-hydroxybutyrate) depolymerase n=1 Tax=Oceanospirillum sediminis TaxID=2760088 RepID=A0A839IQ33_9GAMM|nr:PHB depolymerase family esterase [Oceanospirillum sediminis]MBB1486557.1 poly(3-hydroxybutyrate) depolymerase [Oceanospirillum sediminis]